MEAQSPVWFIVYQPLGFIIYLISAVAECSRTPFDLTECENELVAGYQTEYSSMKFALYYLAEYAHILVVSSLAVTLFFGGWHGPFLPPVLWFLIKIFYLYFLFHLGPGDVPPVPVRPADEIRLESSLSPCLC